ncbi:hypothetical protein [Mycolicibacterium gadium]|uniref:Uncharacterized protein n=1 Tax=Mycolicibacterium gadium TaxID=1794 RepID=A0ABT6GKZ6_MYCGU|nr:hypothetical protein [Mycolicibacterium gadium]MDG5482011.1 hypothetical protein [Mycolicibacterium gadium]
MREIERRLRLESPELVRLFDDEDSPAPQNFYRRTKVRTLLAAAAITGRLLLGPRTLTDTEIRRLQRARKDCVSHPDARTDV